MTCTTINTDAGVKNNVGAIAYWIRSSTCRTIGSMKLKSENPDSTFAEIAGIITALLVVIQNPKLHADYFVVNCDSKEALRKVRTGDLPEIFIEYHKRIFNIIDINKVTFRWVKGHSSMNTARNYINNWCDQEVRKHYDKQKKKIPRSHLGLVQHE